LDSIQESRAEQFQCKRIQTASQRRQQYRMDVFTSIFGQQYELCMELEQSKFTIETGFMEIFFDFLILVYIKEYAKRFILL
jgi:hypothetical protein